MEVLLKGHMESTFSLDKGTRFKQFPVFLFPGYFPVVNEKVTVCNVLSIVQLVCAMYPVFREIVL